MKTINPDEPASELSVRAYLAGQALIGLLAAETREWDYKDYDCAAVAATSAADALLKALNRYAEPDKPAEL